MSSDHLPPAQLNCLAAVQLSARTVHLPQQYWSGFHRRICRYVCSGWKSEQCFGFWVGWAGSCLSWWKCFCTLDKLTRDLQGDSEVTLRSARSRNRAGNHGSRNQVLLPLPLARRS